MKQLLSETESLCPECLRRISAQRIAENGNVYLEKVCQDHGTYKVLIWRGDSIDYINWGKDSQPAAGPLKTITEVDMGCPHDCGLCPEHKANTCTLVMEVTQRCNLRCPVCFASAGTFQNSEPDLETIRKMYETVLKTTGTPSIQLSGGEPTLRDDLPQIVSLAKKMGFEHIMINTNGIRIAKDEEYLDRLVESGAGTIYLQFDSITDEAYRVIRGIDLFQHKMTAMRNCAKAKIGVVLVPVLIRGVNDHQIGDMIRFAKQWIPTVKGVHFQPLSYFGRYPGFPKDEDRITIPDIIRSLIEQTDDDLSQEYFLPRRSEDSHCAFSGHFLLDKTGRLSSIHRRGAPKLVSIREAPEKPPWESARSFMNLHWRYDASRASGSSSPYSLLSSVATRGFTITGMPFQDVWNMDLERLKKCCTHVVTTNKRIIPLCAYYLTNDRGKRLWGQPLTSDISRAKVVSSRQ